LRVIWLWCTRVIWALLPVTMGGAIADATRDWSAAPARLADVMLWAVWAAGLFALFAPRPWGLTFLRIVAPCGFVSAAIAAASTSVASAVLALAGAFVAMVFVLAAPFAAAAANALAYGDEQRFVLRVPLPLILAPVPIAVLLVGVGATAGPLLLADGRVVAGVVTTVIGWLLAALLVHALHPLSCRWLVLVPAGIAIADPLTLTEPVLVRREQIEHFGRLGATALGGQSLDLRVGTLIGGVALELSEPIDFGRRRGRKNAEMVAATLVAVAVVGADDAVVTARSRRIRT
jgi:hypothetical protein